VATPGSIREHLVDQRVDTWIRESLQVPRGKLAERGPLLPIELSRREPRAIVDECVHQEVVEQSPICNVPGKTGLLEEITLELDEFAPTLCLPSGCLRSAKAHT
jgi:hypothetical protein